MMTIASLAEITQHPDNVFLFWDGRPPDPDRLEQIRVCLRSVRRHAPDARVHLFSNVIEPGQVEIPEVHLVRWDRQELVAGSPLAGRCPEPNGDWVHWSDLFRVTCLWRWGGSYWDPDNLLIRPITAPQNAMAACFLTLDQAVRWQPAPIVDGCHAFDRGRLACTVSFRLGNDPLLNFSPGNPFLEAWLDRIPASPKTDWGQILPTQIFSNDPDRWRRAINAVPWADLLFHPYDGGHHPDDQRYAGPRQHSDQALYRREFLRGWPRLWENYAFPLVKNHDWRCQQAQWPRQSLLHWVVQQCWSANGVGPAFLGLGGRNLENAWNAGGLLPAPPRIAPGRPADPDRVRKLILNCPLPPGDIVVLTAAVRDLHRRYPGKFLTDVRTNHPQIWSFNPHITPISDRDPEAETVDCHYPLISQSNQLPNHFLEGYVDYLNRKLSLEIRLTEFRGDIHLRADERTVATPLEERLGYRGRYWLVAAGGKRDFTIKWWDQKRYQQVINRFHGRIQFVQVGAAGDFHPELDGVLDLRGRTDLRQLIRLIYHADGIICPVTSLMHLAAAVPTPSGDRLRPCIVVAGGREPAHWEAYPGHQFLHTIGLLRCCATGGCWRARTKPLNDGSHFNGEHFLCADVVGSLPRCMDMITVDEVVRRVELVLAGGDTFSSPAQVSTVQVGAEFDPPAVVVKDPNTAPEDLLIRHFTSVRTSPKPTLREDLSGRALTNNSLGLGDTIILTTLPAEAARQGMLRYVDSDSQHFETLMRHNRHYVPAQGRVRAAIGFLGARYDLGNGHLTQMIHRAFGLRPADRPGGHLDCVVRPTPRRVAFHFEAGTHSLWQRNHIHPRARQLYPESRAILQEFVRQHPDWTFIQLGSKATPFDGVADATGLPLEQTIAMLAQCEYFVGIVSGPMHLATALGLKCIVLLNFPEAHAVMLPTLKFTGVVESEWLYPQNVHLHQEDDAPLVRRLTLSNLNRAFEGELYPFWSERFLSLIHERIPEP